VATCFWVGGTGTWDGGTLDVGHWKTASGGSTNIAAPGSADTATFDANSGGGTVTVASDFNVNTIQSGAFTGTLDFSVNNNSVNISNIFSVSGSGVRTVKFGSSIITVSQIQAGTITNLTFDSGTSTVRFFNSTTTGGLQSPIGGGVAHNKFIIGPATTGIGVVLFSGGALTLNTLEWNNVNAGAMLQLNSSVNMTMNNSFYWKGSPSRPIGLQVGSTPPGTLTLGAGKTGVIEWASIYGVTFTGGGTFIAKNCFDGGGNTGITFIAPQSSPIGGR